MSKLARRGVPIVVSAPSGAGKTTLCRRLQRRQSNVVFSVSHTTRAPRPGETDGVDYHFVDREAFFRRVSDGTFLEWAEVHGNHYGTDAVAAGAQLDAGVDVLFELDVQGGEQVASKLTDAVLVFVLPPDMNTLAERLRGRQSDSEQVVRARLAAAADEIRTAARTYSHFIVNDDLERAVDALEAVVVAERLRQVDRSALLNGLLGEDGAVGTRDGR